MAISASFVSLVPDMVRAGAVLVNSRLKVSLLEGLRSSPRPWVLEGAGALAAPPARGATFAGAVDARALVAEAVVPREVIATGVAASAAVPWFCVVVRGGRCR